MSDIKQINNSFFAALLPCLQELEYNIECLSTELSYCRAKLEEAQANKTVERSEEDVKLLEEKDQQIVKLREEVYHM